MVNRLLHPQEVEIFYILPAIRRELTLAMKSEGKSQKDIAKVLGVTCPAVSQYMKSKRAALKLGDSFKREIIKSAKAIHNETTLFRELQRLLSFARKSRVLCQVHRSLGRVPAGCCACFGGKK